MWGFRWTVHWGVPRGQFWEIQERQKGQRGRQELHQDSEGRWRRGRRSRVGPTVCQKPSLHLHRGRAQRAVCQTWSERKWQECFQKWFLFYSVLLFLKGPLSELHFPIDSLTKKTKGFAFITYMIPENAVAALAQLDGHVFQVTVT